MSDLKIKRIRIRNWARVKTADLTFPEKGLVLVLGSNLASDGKLLSVGAGKSCLGEALSRALTGVSGRFSELGHYAPDNDPKNLLVTVDAELLGKPLLVEMGYKSPELSKTGEGLRFTYDGNIIQRGHVDRTREELSRTIQVTPELADWTVFLDGDKLKFNKLPQQESVKLLMTALAQPPWMQYYEHATKVLQDSRQQVAVVGRSLDSAKSRLQDLTEDLQRAKADHATAVKDHQRQVDELQGRILQLRKDNINDTNAIAAAQLAADNAKKQATALEEQRKVVARATALKLQSLKANLDAIDKARLTAVEEKSVRIADRNQALKALETMKKVPKTCPTCNKPWDKAHSDSEISKAQAAYDTRHAAYMLTSSAYDAQNAIRRTAYDDVAKIERQDNDDNDCYREDIDAAKNLAARNERLVRDLGSNLQQREHKIVLLEQGPDASSVSKANAVIEERQRMLEGGEEAITNAAADLAAEEQVLRVVEYWHKAFGPAGIPNMVLSDAIAPLNRVAQRISSLMTGGTLQISYSTRRDLVAGGSKAQLVIKVENRIGSKRLEGSSKGEAGLTNLIIAENISEIGQVSSRIGFRFYDEITSGMDAVVRRSIFAYLKEVAHRLGILIFVVDHHAEAANYSDYILMAEKTDKDGTRFYWK